MQNMEIFSVVKNENFIRFFFLIFAQNIDCRYSLEPPYEYSQSMFWSKKNRYTPVLLYKSGVQGGIHYTDMFS